MKVRMHTAMAHPKIGVARVGQVIEVPDAYAKELIASKFAEAVTVKSATPAARETAMSAGPAEKAVQAKPAAKETRSEK
jgi:hypothetical protein